MASLKVKHNRPEIDSEEAIETNKLDNALAFWPNNGRPTLFLNYDELRSSEEV